MAEDPTVPSSENISAAEKQQQQFNKAYAKFLSDQEDSYDLSKLFSKQVEQQVGKMNKLGSECKDLAQKQKKQLEIIEKQEASLSRIKERYDAQKSIVTKLENEKIALANKQTSQENDLSKIQDKKLAQEQALGKLKERNDKVFEMQIKVEEDLANAKKSNDSGEIERLLKKQKMLNSLSEFQLQEIRDGNLKLANITREEDASKKLLLVTKQQLRDKKQEEAAATDVQRSLEAQITAKEKLLKKEKDGLADIQSQLAQKEQALKTEKSNLEVLKLKQGITKQIDGLLGETGESYGKVKGLVMDIAKGGATAWLAVIKASLDRWKELDKAAEDFRNKTGFLVSQTRELDKAAREVNVSMANIGVSIGAAYEAAGALTEQFQVIGLVTKDMIASTAQMAANLGFAVADTVKFRGLFTSIAKTSGSTADTLMQSAAALAEMGGVAPSAVMKDMAEASAETLSFLAKSPIALIKASVEARRLGTTVNSLSKSARGFLNFQESVTSELEASALIGRSLNFQEARAAAYAGDVVKSRELALKQLEKAGDFTKLNVFQQEALAKAAGMTVDEVIKQQNQQKMLAEFKAKATGKDKEMLDKYEAMQKKIAENEKDAGKDLAAKGAEMVRQQMRQSEMNKLTNAFNAIWTDISDSLLAIANAIMPPIITTARLLGSVFKIIGAVIRGFLTPFDKIGASLRSGAEGGLTLEKVMSAISTGVEIAVPYIEKLAEVVGYAVNAFAFLAVMIGKGAAGAKPFVKIAEVFESIATRIGTWGDKLKGIFKIFSPVLKGFQGISKFLGTFTRFLGPIGLIISALQVIWEFGKSLIEIWSSDDMNIGEKIIMSLVAIPKAIWNALVQPIFDGIGWIVNKILPGAWDDFVTGVKSVGNTVLGWLKWPFQNFLGWFKDDSGIAGQSPSEIGLMLVDGLKSVGSMIIDVMTWPFRTVLNFISGIFGGDGSLGDTIIGGLKAVMGGVFDILISPFKAAFGFIQKIPLIGKLFGSGDATATVNSDVKSTVEKQVSMAVEVKNLDELKETVDKLTEAISKLGGTAGGAAPVVNVNNNQAAMVDKLDELIELLRSGAIGINMDGIEVSKALARAS